MLCSLPVLAADNVPAVSITVRNMPIKKVLRSIEQQSRCKFSYSEFLLQGIPNVTVSCRNTPIDILLDRIFRTTGLTYEIMSERTIVIYRAAPEAEPNIADDYRSIGGRILDRDGTPLVGATVRLDGSPIAVCTDVDGRFTIDGARDGQKIIVTYIGYRPTTFTVGSGDQYDLNMRSISTMLSDVVVVGYGLQKKINLTGAVSAIDFGRFGTSRPVTTLSNSLAGLSAGVSVMQISGQPGNDGADIRIRGVGTMNDASPLVLIDGMEGSMDNVNPGDVESISVLKDAASCAIYGSRAANGVILVTTRRGVGRARVSYNGRVSFVRPANLIDFVSDFATYMELINESFVNLGREAHFSQHTIDLWREKSLRPNDVNELGVPNYVAYPNTDWQKVIFNNDVVQDHNISLSGVTDKTRFLVSMGYLDNPGLVDRTGIRRYSFRVNLDSEIQRWLRIGTITYGNITDTGAGNFSEANNYMRQTTPGIYPEWNGAYGYPEAPEDSSTANGLLSFLNNQDGTRKSTDASAMVFARITPFKGFSWTVNFQYRRHWFEERLWTHATDKVKFSTGQVMVAAMSPENMTTSFENSGNWSYTFENLLDYSTTLGGSHNIHALAGYQEWYYYSNSSGGELKGLVDESVNLPSSAADMVSISGSASDRSTRSWFGRLNYDYRGRYLAEANLRIDGNSRYSSRRRWGHFPSLSAGWRLSEEPFMEGTRRWLDNLKIRASWGQLGNDGGTGVGNYEYQSTYGVTRYSFNGKEISGLAVTGMINSRLGWETSTTTDLGIDASMLGNRLTATFDMYNKRTKGILTTTVLPLTMGDLESPRVNHARMDSRGFEMDMGWRDRIGNVSYSVNANFACNTNKVLSYSGPYVEGWRYLAGTNAKGEPVYGYTRDKYAYVKYTDKSGNITTDDSKKFWTNNADHAFDTSGSVNPIVEGHMLNEYYLLPVYTGSGRYFDESGKVLPDGGPRDGMIRTEQDMEWLRAMFDAGYDFMPCRRASKEHIWYGDLIYADTNGDGTYGSAYDKAFCGTSAHPKFTFGLRAAALWHGVDFSMLWAGAAGRKLYWGDTTGYNSTGTRLGCGLSHQIVDDHYFYDPDFPDDPRTNIDAANGRLVNGESGFQIHQASRHYLFNGNYLKLKNLTLGYTLPSEITRKFLVSNLRFYVSGENLLSIDSFPGQDPELGATPGYTSTRTLALGVSVTF